MRLEDDAPGVRTIGQRLATLRLPESDALAGRVIQRYQEDRRGRDPQQRPARRRRVVLAAAVAVALVTALLLGTGMGPTLASAPVVSPVVARILALIGAPQPAPLTASSTSAGQTVRLVGGYADAVWTVLVVEVSPSGAQPVDATLTDASGASQRVQSVLGGANGDMILTYGALSRPRLGDNPLTLHVTELLPWAAGKGQPDAGPRVAPIAGNWTLHFALPYNGGEVLPAPPPGRLGSVTVTFETVAVSPSTIHVRFETAGATSDQLFELGPLAPCASGVQCVPEPKGPPGPGAFSYQLLDPDGRSMNALVQSGGGGKGTEGADHLEWDELYARTGPGTYHLVLRWDGHRVERDIVVR